FHAYTCSHSPFLLFVHTLSSYIYPLSLHDALPIFTGSALAGGRNGEVSDTLHGANAAARPGGAEQERRTRGNVEPTREPKGLRVDRKSTRLNSSHVSISYAVFCLKKKTRT